MGIRNCDLLTRLCRTRPLLLASLLFLLGCIFGYAMDAPILPCALAAAALLALCAALWGGRRSVAAALAILAMLPLGMLRFSLEWHAVAPLPDQVGATLSGRICAIPEWRDETQRCVCVLEDLEIDGAAVDGRLRLYLRGEDSAALQNVCAGQRIRCTAHIWRADEDSNPGQFNFSNYLRVRGLRGYATAKIEDAAFTPGALKPTEYPAVLREKLGGHIDRLFPRSSELARAFLLGDRSELSEDDRRVYAASGAAHLLAISGMHISVLAMAVSLLLGRFLRRRYAFLITLTLLLAYGTLLGFTASLSRAILMFALLGTARIAGRYSDGPTRLGAAMLICLLVHPSAILDAGFVLSFGASAGILLLRAPLSRLLHLDGLMERKPRQSLPRRMLAWCADMLVCTLAAQLAVLPAVVHYFGAQSLVSVAVNLIAVPLAMAAYIASIIGALSCLAPVAAVGDLLFALLTDIVELFAALPMASLRIPRFPLWLTLLCVLAFLLSSELSHLPGRLRRFLPLTAVLAVFIANGCSMLGTAGCSILFLDAGQADCAVIHSEGRVYLVDTGDSYSPAADYLSATGYTPEAVFLSHLHSDHAGGLDSILEICTPGALCLPVGWEACETDEAVLAAIAEAEARGAEIITLDAGSKLALSAHTQLQVLSPDARALPDDANDASMVLRLSHRDTVALFCGDATAPVLEGKLGDADILKVGHHGSRSSLSPALLAEVSPSAAVISSGYNSYGHPAPETLALLERAGAAVLRTDHCGAISVRLGGGGEIAVTPYLNSEAEDGLE